MESGLKTKIRNLEKSERVLQKPTQVTKFDKNDQQRAELRERFQSQIHDRINRKRAIETEKSIGSILGLVIDQRLSWSIYLLC